MVLTCTFRESCYSTYLSCVLVRPEDSPFARPLIQDRKGDGARLSWVFWLKPTLSACHPRQEGGMGLLTWVWSEEGKQTYEKIHSRRINLIHLMKITSHWGQTSGQCILEALYIFYISNTKINMFQKHLLFKLSTCRWSIPISTSGRSLWKTRPCHNNLRRRTLSKHYQPGDIYICRAREYNFRWGGSVRDQLCWSPVRLGWCFKRTSASAHGQCWNSSEERHISHLWSSKAYCRRQDGNCWQRKGWLGQQNEALGNRGIQDK